MIPLYKKLIIQNVEENKVEFLNKYYAVLNKIQHRAHLNQDDIFKLSLLGYNLNDQYIGTSDITDHFILMQNTRNFNIYVSTSRKYIRKCFKGVNSYFLNEVFIYTLFMKYNLYNITPRLVEVGYNKFIDQYFITFEFIENQYKLGIFSTDNLLDFVIKINKFHLLGITHNDIKPDNLILSPEGNVYIIDFEFCKISFPFKGTRPLLTLDKFTPLYAPLEKLTARSSIDFVVKYSDDIWAMGITILEAYVGVDIFKDCSTVAQLRSSIRTQITEDNLKNMFMSLELSDLMISILINRADTSCIIEKVTQLIYH